MALIKRHQINKRLTQSRRSYRTMRLFLALTMGDASMVKCLLKEGGLRINVRLAGSKQTLLHTAIYHENSISVIRRLVRGGCRVNSADSLGDTALHTAIFYHRLDEARHLIRLGANVRAKNIYGETLLHFAVFNKTHVNVLKDMIPNGDRYKKIKFYGLSSLRVATGAGKTRDWIPELLAKYQGKNIYGAELHRLVKILLDAGADINARDVDGCSPLHCAVYTGDVELVTTLIDAGADLNHQNLVGTTALHDAVLCCNEAMVHLLLSRGARVDIEVGYSGDTALHWAARLNIDNSHVTVIRMLMDFGSDLNYENAYAETPFNHILQLGDVELVKLFIDKYKADLHSLQSDGTSALAFAAENENERVIDLVLESGVDVNHRCTRERLTPLHHATGLSLLGNVRQLISRGADVNAEDCLEQTPLFYCIYGLSSYDDLDFIPVPFYRTNYAEERRRVMQLLLESGTDPNNLANTSETAEPNKQSILEFAIDIGDVEACTIIIRYAAEVEARTNAPLFDEHNLRVIKKYPEVESLYWECQAELTAMRTTNIAEDSFVNYFSVLTEQLDTVARYTRNDEFVENFESKLQSYPIYKARIKEKINAGIARQAIIEQVYRVLSSMLQFTDPTNVVIENIFGYLTEADIKLLLMEE